MNFINKLVLLYASLKLFLIDKEHHSSINTFAIREIILIFYACLCSELWAILYLRNKCMLDIYRYSSKASCFF